MTAAEARELENEVVAIVEQARRVRETRTKLAEQRRALDQSVDVLAKEHDYDTAAVEYIEAELRRVFL